MIFVMALRDLVHSTFQITIVEHGLTFVAKRKKMVKILDLLFPTKVIVYCHFTVLQSNL